MDIYRADWVVSLAGPPIPSGALVVDEGRILQVAPADRIDAPFRSTARVHDLGASILLPGFVNAHTHLELTCYRNCLPPGPLWPWLEGLISLRSETGAGEKEQEAVRAGAVESMIAGVTCVGDISRTGMAVEILRDQSIRKVCYIELISGATQPPDSTAALAVALEHYKDSSMPGRLFLGVSPHAPYTVTEDDLLGTAALAKAVPARLAMHLLETAEEANWLSGKGDLPKRFRCRGLADTAFGHPGIPLGLLERTGILNGEPLLAHANYVTDEQLDHLAASRASVVWCPRAHRYFGHADHRWLDMIDRGINVCVGTDSVASNDSLSILDELRYLRCERHDLPPELLLELGTSRGARALGLGDRLGSLEVGKLADFVAIPHDPGGPKNPMLNLLDGRAVVQGVWIGGNAVTADSSSSLDTQRNHTSGSAKHA